MKIYLVFLFSLISLTSFGQTSMYDFAKNELKYWKLRGRLIGDDNNKDIYNGFITLGDGKGLSIPAASKHPSYNRNNFDFHPFDLGDCKLQTINSVPIFAEYDANGNLTSGQPLIDPRDGKELKGILKFSDNSLINIGMYISVLATEWALLKRSNADRTQTEMELYYALKALDRLDLAGENFYSNTPQLNGFLMRNDADEFFQLNTNGKNIDIVNTSIACKRTLSPCSESNLSNSTPNVMSQDEVIGLLQGFALMRKMLPEYASYNGMAFRQKSRELTERIVDYVKKTTAAHFWLIVDPINKDRVCKGSMTIWKSYAIAAAARYIFNDLPFAFQNGWSLSIGFPMWQIQKNFYAANNLTSTTADLTVLFGLPPSIATGLNLLPTISFDLAGVGKGRFRHDGAYNASMYLRLASISKTGARIYLGDFNGKTTIASTAESYWKEIYDLLSSVIVGYTPVFSQSYWRDELNKLTCSCNCMQGNNITSWQGCDNYHKILGTAAEMRKPNNPWAVEDRWGFALNKEGDIQTHAEYNGLDYMLTYNLYRYKFFSDGYYNRVRLKWSNTTFPYSSTPNPYNSNTISIGSTQYPKVSKAVFSIDSWNTTVSANSNVTFTAGSDVKLLPGFHAKAGSIFKANIAEYDCTPSTYNVGGVGATSWKNGIDETMWDYDIDTSEQLQVDADSMGYQDEIPNFDSNAYIFTYSPNGDSISVTLHPDYSYSEDGDIVYTPPGSNKMALEPYTQKSITVYPNPSSGDVYIEYALYKTSDVQMHITNQLGQEVVSNSNLTFRNESIGQHTHLLPTANLVNGIYFCLIDINGKKSTKKFALCR